MTLGPFHAYALVLNVNITFTVLRSCFSFGFFPPPPLAPHSSLFTSSRTITWGGAIFAPLVTGWFKVLNKVPMKNKVKGTVIRVALDQLISAPIMITGESRHTVAGSRTEPHRSGN